MATGFDATLTGLGSIVCAALGPLPRVSPETVHLDLERARMTAEDHAQGNAVMHRYRDGAGLDRAETWRQMNKIHIRNLNDQNDQMGRTDHLMEEARTGALRAIDSKGNQEDFRLALVVASNLLVNARRALRDEDSESEEMSDEEMSDGGASDEEEGLFCEACDAYYRQGVVAWYTEPFMHNGRTLYSACALCRRDLNLQDRPVDHW